MSLPAAALSLKMRRNFQTSIKYNLVKALKNEANIIQFRKNIRGNDFYNFFLFTEIRID